MVTARLPHHYLLEYPHKLNNALNIICGILCFLMLALAPPDVNAISGTQATDTFQINPGLNDAWYDPVTDGQGFFITVFPELGLVTLAWFTYDTIRPANGVDAHLGEPGHRWLTATGEFSGNQAVLPMEIASGGLFDSATAINRINDGTITLTFNDCAEGTVEYNIPSLNLSGTIPIQRIVDDNLAKCEQLSGTEKYGSSIQSSTNRPQADSFQINPGMNDAWYNPATDGQGFFITVFRELGLVTLAWFTYDTVRPANGVNAQLGEPGHRWLTATGEFSGNQAVLPIEIASGGLFDTATAIARRQDGTITLTFNSCNEGSVEYNIPSVNRHGTVPIQRVAADNTVLCKSVNAVPVAEAGPDQIVLGGSRVNLVGERSTDADGDFESVHWQQRSGPRVALQSANSLNASFTAPDVSGSPSHPDGSTTLSFQITVRDDKQASDTDSINIKVQPANLEIAMQRVSGNGSENPLLSLLDQAGNVLESAQGSNIVINSNLPAGVYYAVSSADSPIDLDVQISASTGLEINRSIRPSEMTGFWAFLNTAAIEQADILPLLVNADHAQGDGHLQFIEFSLRDPDPALRDPDEFLQFVNQQSLRYYEDAATAEAYYQAVDPFRDRLSLSDWQFVNGFSVDPDKDEARQKAHAIYQNDVDLGFGRDMYARENKDGTVASYVRNFPSIEHAVLNDSLIATVAMEFSPPEGGGAAFTKFFAFGPDGSRILAADLDGRGAKFMPGLCNVCHGGQPKRLTVNEAGEVIYPDDGDTQAQFLPWDVATFKFAKNRADISRSAQEPDFRDLNKIALATYPKGPVPQGSWTGAAATDLINGWYRRNPDIFDEGYFPSAWAQDSSLYLDVVGPNCRACHINRGTSLQNTIDFGSYEKFMRYAPQIRSMVFDQGVMPLAVRTFGHFWSGGNNSPARQLAEALPAEYGLVFEHVRGSSGTTLEKPGRPIANTGMLALPAHSTFLITGKANEIVLDGRASRFPSNLDWQVSSWHREAEQTDQRENLAITTQSDIEPQGSDRLVRQIAGPGEVRRISFIRAQLAANNPRIPPSFFTELWDRIGGDCGSCHKPSGPGAVAGIPVFFAFPGSSGSAELELVYRNVLERIDFDDPLNSLMLTKPGGLRHGGGIRNGWQFFNPDGEVADFFERGSGTNLLMEWVQNGARLRDNIQARVCRDTGIVIPDNDSSGIRDRIYIGPAAKISDLKIQVDLVHERAGDLTIRLNHPESGRSVLLLNGRCGSSRDVIGTFDDGGSTTSGICNNTGASNLFRPANPLGSLDGGLVNGFWELEIRDLIAGSSGSLEQWCVINSVP